MLTFFDLPAGALFTAGGLLLRKVSGRGKCPFTGRSFYVDPRATVDLIEEWKSRRLECLPRSSNFMTPISQEEFRAMNERAQRKADAQRAAIAVECSALAPYLAEQLENTPYTGRDAILCVDTHEQADAYGKANGKTVTYAAWHPNPDYRIFKTGSLLSRNDEYPSGLILVDEKGKPHQFKI